MSNKTNISKPWKSWTSNLELFGKFKTNTKTTNQKEPTMEEKKVYVVCDEFVSGGCSSPNKLHVFDNHEAAYKCFDEIRQHIKYDAEKNDNIYEEEEGEVEGYACTFPDGEYSEDHWCVTLTENILEK